jgi:hypothetical protein
MPETLDGRSSCLGRGLVRAPAFFFEIGAMVLEFLAQTIDIL